MSYRQLVTRYWILAISISCDCECNRDCLPTEHRGLQLGLHVAIESTRYILWTWKDLSFAVMP